MMTDELKKRLTDFAEKMETFYGRSLTISESISTNRTNFDRHFATFGQYQMNLENVNWRMSGGRIKFSHAKSYYEISIDNLESFSGKENRFEFLEKYSESVFRKTVLDFEPS